MSISPPGVPTILSITVAELPVGPRAPAPHAAVVQDGTRVGYTDRDSFDLESKRRPSNIKDWQVVAHLASRAVPATLGVTVAELPGVIHCPSTSSLRHRHCACMIIRASEIGVRPFRRKRERTSRVLAVRIVSGGFDPAHPARDAPPRLNALVLEARKLVPMTRWPVRRVYLIGSKMGQPGVGAREHPRRDRVVGKGPARDVLVEARSSGEQILRVHNLRPATSQSGMSEQPKAPHRLIAVSSYQHLGSEEQHFSPDGTASRHASTAAFSSVPSASAKRTQPFLSTPGWCTTSRPAARTRGCTWGRRTCRSRGRRCSCRRRR